MERDPAEHVISDVGRRIAEVRRERGWTQQEAAERLRMPLKNLQRIEAGMNMTIRTLVRVARGLGVPTQALFDEPASREGRRAGRPPRAYAIPEPLLLRVAEQTRPKPAPKRR